VTRSRVVYGLRCSSWSFRPDEPELLRVPVGVGWRAPCCNDRTCCQLAIHTRQASLVVDSQACLRAALDTP
jgi:hypothetical protein